MAYFGLTGSNKQGRKNHVLPLLTLLIIITAILSIFAIAPLESEDRISISRGCYLFGLGLVFFTALFNFVNHVALKTPSGLKFKKKYHLTASDILDISNKLVSSVQAILSCLTGIIVCTYSCTRDFLHTSHYVSEAYAWFGASYFFYDIWSMYKVHTCDNNHIQKSPNEIAKSKNVDNIKERNKNGNSKQQIGRNEFMKFGSYIKTHPVILMHHLFIGSFGFLVIVYLRGGLGDCVFGYVYLMELSTPFVSLRGVLSQLGMKQSNWYITNGLVMLGTFFFCRVAMFPYVCYLYSEVVDLPYLQAIMSLPKGCKIGILILLIPQFYWFYLMLKGATKVFCGPNLKQLSSTTNTGSNTTTTTSSSSSSSTTTTTAIEKPISKKQKRAAAINHNNTNSQNHSS